MRGPRSRLTSRAGSKVKEGGKAEMSAGYPFMCNPELQGLPFLCEHFVAQRAWGSRDPWG